MAVEPLRLAGLQVGRQFRLRVKPSKTASVFGYLAELRCAIHGHPRRVLHPPQQADASTPNRDCSTHTAAAARCSCGTTAQRCALAVQGQQQQASSIGRTAAALPHLLLCSSVRRLSCPLGVHEQLVALLDGGLLASQRPAERLQELLSLVWGSSRCKVSVSRGQEQDLVSISSRQEQEQGQRLASMDSPGLCMKKERRERAAIKADAGSEQQAAPAVLDETHRTQRTQKVANQRGGLLARTCSTGLSRASTPLGI